MNKRLLENMKIKNLGEVKENDLLVFQFDYKKIDAKLMGSFMKLIREDGYKAVAYPQIDKLVEKHDIDQALKIIEITKNSLLKMKES